MRATAQMDGLGDPHHEKTGREWRRKFITPISPQGREKRIKGARGVPYATSQVLKYKAREIKRTLPLKYSTNLSMEAKGQWATSLPNEGEGRMRTHTVSGCGTPPYQGLNAASAPGMGRGEEKG